MNKEEQDLKKKIKNLRLNVAMSGSLFIVATAGSAITLLNNNVNLDTVSGKVYFFGLGMITGMTLTCTMYEHEKYKQAKRKLKEIANKHK